jgi:hypothetical protein
MPLYLNALDILPQVGGGIKMIIDDCRLNRHDDAKTLFFRHACAAWIFPCRELFADERGNRFGDYRYSIIDGNPETRTLCLRQTFSVL